MSFRKLFTKNIIRVNQIPLYSLVRTMSSGWGKMTGNESISRTSVHGAEKLFQGKWQFKVRSKERKEKGGRRQKTGIIRES